ncbi:hypothetical protein SISNIDRAFT_471919, partial [Sistotremastrum niveocremeum HHB9708]
MAGSSKRAKNQSNASKSKGNSRKETPPLTTRGKAAQDKAQTAAAKASQQKLPFTSSSKSSKKAATQQEESSSNSGSDSNSESSGDESDAPVAPPKKKRKSAKKHSSKKSKKQRTKEASESEGGQSKSEAEEEEAASEGDEVVEVDAAGVKVPATASDDIIIATEIPLPTRKGQSRNRQALDLKKTGLFSDRVEAVWVVKKGVRQQQSGNWCMICKEDKVQAKGPALITGGTSGCRAHARTHHYAEYSRRCKEANIPEHDHA